MINDFFHMLILILITLIISILTTDFKKVKSIDNQINDIKCSKDYVLRIGEINDLKNQKLKAKRIFLKSLIFFSIFIFYFNFVHTFKVSFIFYYLPLKIILNLLILNKIRRFFYDRA